MKVLQWAIISRRGSRGFTFAVLLLAIKKAILSMDAMSTPLGDQRAGNGNPHAAGRDARSGRSRRRYNQSFNGCWILFSTAATLVRGVMPAGFRLPLLSKALFGILRIMLSRCITLPAPRILATQLRSHIHGITNAAQSCACCCANERAFIAIFSKKRAYPRQRDYLRR